jgi:phosphatidylserine/phosphatidylglycerophosphate/cardiolipin synthase-like enzyme
MHDKVIIVDNHTVESGSFNMTRSASSRNSENVLVINDVPEVAQTYLQHWQSRWDGERSGILHTNQHCNVICNLHPSG